MRAALNRARAEFASAEVPVRIMVFNPETDAWEWLEIDHTETLVFHDPGETNKVFAIVTKKEK